jgi:hypothetical protein
MPTKLRQACSDSFDGLIVLPRIAVVRFDPFDGPEIDLHVGGESLNGFHTGQQDAEPEWQKV